MIGHMVFLYGDIFMFCRLNLFMNLGITFRLANFQFIILRVSYNRLKLMDCNHPYYDLKCFICLCCLCDCHIGVRFI